MYALNLSYNRSQEKHSTHCATTEDNARLDVATSGFWGRKFESAFLMRGSSSSTLPQTEPFRQLSATSAMNVRRGASMRTGYGEWSMPLLHPMSCTGRAGPSATIFKRLAAMQAEKHNSTYSTVMALLQCRLSFALLQSSITCLRSARSSFQHPG